MALTQVSSEGIKDAQVKTADILDANITTAKVADDAITNAKIANNSINGNKLQDDCVATSEIQDNAVTSAKIPDLAIGTSKIAVGAVATNRLAVQDGNVDFNDSGKIRLGTGNDLQIFHNGSNSYIDDTGTGDLFIRGSNDLYITNPDGTETKARFATDGAVYLYHNNVNKAETTADGLTINGVTVSTGNIQINSDGPAVKLGASQDLQLYHDGSNSHIVDVGTGSLLIKGDAVHIGSTGGEYYFRGFENGAVSLRYDNVTKLETVATGVQFAQDFRCTNNAGNNTAALQWYKGGDALYFADSIKALFGASSDLQIFHDGYNRICGDHLYINNKANSEVMIYAAADGAVQLYHNNGQRLYTSTTGAVVVSGGDTTLSVNGGAGDSGYAQLYLNGNASADNWIQSDNGLAYWINGAHRYKMDTDGTFIVQDGNVKIGTAGHGIDFSATGDGSGTDSSELLDDYEEGTFTLSDYSGASLSITNTAAAYVKVGKMIMVNFYIQYPTTSDTNLAYLAGLPYGSTGSNNYYYLGGRIANITDDVEIQVNQNTSLMRIYIGDLIQRNNNLSGKTILVSGVYREG